MKDAELCINILQYGAYELPLPIHRKRSRNDITVYGRGNVAKPLKKWE
jgi:hypothetical protein